MSSQNHKLMSKIEQHKAENTDKAVCREVVRLLEHFGVKNVVLSPGSRNAPLIMAVVRSDSLCHHIVVDERSAAFVALGMAAQSQRPVALVCTSGTALLNYAPAVAEAFYRGVPLIVVSADRPAEWIDQDDSQTIHQSGALDNIVKYSVDIPVESGSDVQMWMINRKLNDALIAATTPMQGPVHINVQLEVPLTNTCYPVVYESSRTISCVLPDSNISTSRIRAIGAELAPPRKVLVIAGFLAPSDKVCRAVTRLAAMPNIAVLAEAQANLHSKGVIGNIDRVLGAIPPDRMDDLRPDVVITFGGSLVSRLVKDWLRGLSGIEHWHIGRRGLSVDCFRCLTRRIELPESNFLSQLASAVQIFRNDKSDYASLWHKYEKAASVRYKEYLSRVPWCDMCAVDAIVKAVPSSANLHVSNGTPVRYLQLSDYCHIHRVDCNRGVSGIDGCTSTAIGAAMEYAGQTVLITGDMSAQYDLSAFAINRIPPNFRMFVINNGGGGIFRFIKSTRCLDELDECFAVGNNLPLKNIAEGFGFDYVGVSDLKSLCNVLDHVFVTGAKPCIIEVCLPPDAGAPVLIEFFRNNKIR